MSTHDIWPDGSPAGDDAVRPIYNEHTVNEPVNEHVIIDPIFGADRFGKTPRGPGPDVGRFTQGNEASQWVLRRYLLSRAIGASIVRTVQWFGVLLFALAVGIGYLGVTWLAVLVGLAAIFVLLFRVLLSGIQRRLSGIEGMGTAGGQVERLVGQTRKGIRAELRRVGLPGAPWGPTLVGLRLLRGRRRAETVRKLSQFDLSQVVPTSTLDELHLLLH